MTALRLTTNFTNLTNFISGQMGLTDFISGQMGLTDFICFIFKLGASHHNISNITKPNGLITIFHQNIQHLPSRINALEIILGEIKPHVTILTEHDMKEEEIKRLNINNYKVIAHFSRINKSKGGVMILSERNFEIRQVAVPNSLSAKLIEEMQFEFSACSYVTAKNKIVIIGIYGSPNSDTSIFLDRLSLLINHFSKIFDQIIVGGDYNIDVLKNDNKHKLFKEMLRSQNMRYLVDFPTRVTENSETAIDNFVVKNIGTVNITIEGLITSLSDHDGQLLKIKHENPTKRSNSPLKQEIRKFSPENIKLFSHLLNRETWSDVYYASVDKKFSLFHNSFNFYFNQAFPKSLVTKKNKTNNWITEELKAEKVRIVNLIKEFRKNKNYELKVKLNQMKKDYKFKLKKAKSNYFQNKISKSTNIQKTVWRLINNEVEVKERETVNSITLMEGRNTISDPKLVADIFIDHFLNVVKDLGICSHEECENVGLNSNLGNDQIIKPKFRLRPVDKREVEKIIDSFKNKNSSGHDEVPVTVIKAVKTNISTILSHLINSSFVSGIFPPHLKIAKIVPIHKKEDKKMLLTIDLYLFFQHFLKSMKNQCIYNL